MTGPNNTPASNLAEIRRGLLAYCHQGSVYELRALGVGSSRRGVIYGYYDDLERMAQDAASLSGRARGVYFTPNPVSDELVQRSPNGLREFKGARDKAGGAAASTKKLTGDSEILRRYWFLLDFDPVRGNGIKDSPATNGEEQAAVCHAESVANWLSSKGWPDPVMAASGNGCQLSYPVDLPNDESSKLLFRQCLQAIASLFPNPDVKLDTSVFNASRIWKVPGTLSMKGSPTSHRPHRLARILRVAGSSGLVTVPQLEALAAMLPIEDQTRPVSVDRAGYARGYGDYATLDVVAWFRSHGHYGGDLGGGKHAVQCPWETEHSERRRAEDSDSVVWEATTGQWPSFHCSHDHCEGRDIRAVMALWGDADNFCEKKYGRSGGKASKGSGKASAADRVISYVLENGVELFHDQHGEPFITFSGSQERQEVWSLKSKKASEFLRFCFYSRGKRSGPY